MWGWCFGPLCRYAGGLAVRMVAGDGVGLSEPRGSGRVDGEVWRAMGKRVGGSRRRMRRLVGAGVAVIGVGAAAAAVPAFASTPSLPGASSLPSVPGLPGLPSLPGLSSLPGVPSGSSAGLCVSVSQNVVYPGAASNAPYTLSTCVPPGGKPSVPSAPSPTLSVGQGHNTVYANVTVSPQGLPSGTTLPSLPSLPSGTTVPSLPKVPGLPSLPSLPGGL